MTPNTSPEAQLRAENAELRTRLEKTEAALRAEGLSVGGGTDITERQRAEEAVRCSEENYRLLVEGATGFAIIRLELDGRVSMWNVGAERMLGYRDAEILGEHFSVFFTPEDQAAGKPERELDETRVAEKGDDDNWLMRKDGTRFWASGATTALRDEAGKLRGYAKIVRDMTERKVVVEKLRTSEAEFRAVFEQSAVGKAQVCAKTGRFVLVNAKYCALTGYSAEELAGMSPADLDFAEDREADVKAIGAMLSGEVPLYEAEKRYVRKDGQIIWVHVNSTMMHDVDGHPERSMAVIQDITARKRAEAELRESEERFRLLVTATTQIVWTCAPDGVIVEDSPTWRAFTGQTVKQWLGWGWVEALHPDDREATAAAWRGAVETTSAITAEYRLRRHDGEYRWMTVRAVPLLTEAGVLREWIGTNTDITERMQTEEALRERVRLEALRADISTALVSGATLPAVLQQCAEALVKHLDAAFARVWTLNEAENVLEMQASAGLYTHLDGPHGRVKVGEFKIGRIAQSAQPLLTNDVPHDENISDAEWAQREGMVAFAGYPMTLEGRVLGVMAMFARHPLSATVLNELGPITEGIAQWIRRKWAEDVFWKSSQLTTNIVASITDAFITVDKEWRLTFLNQRAEEILRPLRKADHDLPGKNLWQEFPDILGTVAEENYRRCMDGQVTVEFELFYPPLDAWLEVRGYPSKDGISVYFQDITKRKRSEEALRESEERFRTMADNIAPLAWMANADGWIFFYNKRWFDYTGTTLEVMQGWGWEKVHHPDHLKRVVEKWSGHLQRGEAWEDTFPLRGQNGEYRWFDSRAFPIRDASGKISRWFGTNTDIHDQRRATEEIARASRAKDDFLAALSHELRTPLTPVLMMATALASDPELSPEVRDQFAMMRRNIELEARLIDDLLDITRVSSGKLTIAPVIADLHELLGHTNEIIRSDGLGKQVHIVFKLEAALHHALVDPARMQQVFWNVIKNAVKFTHRGGSITVNTRNDETGRIAVSVEDTGIGITAATLPNIFKAFEQGEIAGEHRYGGLGLGLAISHAIVEAHEGEIHAESEGTGCGARFTVTLSTVAASASLPLVPATEPVPITRALRLLIIEDHETTRLVMEKLLTRRGHLVTTASTVQEGLSAYAAGHFDGVISDLGLPDGSGLDLMREIQRQRPVPAIALSGYGMEEDVRQTKEAGFFAHLVKPVNLDQLRQLIDQITPNTAPKP